VARNSNDIVPSWPGFALIYSDMGGVNFEPYDRRINISASASEAKGTRTSVRSALKDPRSRPAPSRPPLAAGTAAVAPPFNLRLIIVFCTRVYEDRGANDTHYAWR